MNQVIDLRSDTVTLPSHEMRNAIFSAPLGDDVFGEDPTVNKLESTAAQIMGKEAGLLVPSGTMGNLVSILTHCARGTEILLGDKSHTFYYEGGGISSFGGIHSRQLKNQKDGTILLEDIKKSIRIDNIHFPKTSAIALENTHNLCNGSPITPSYITNVINIIKNENIQLHIDGARIFNAAIALDLNVKELVKNVDSVTFCLSKGLGAPIGSIVCGSEKFIYHAKRHRKTLGGGMRQAGIIAASGLVALNNIEKQINEDHLNIKRLIAGIEQIDGFYVDKNNIKSNILYFDILKERSKNLLSQTKGKKSYPFEVILDNVYFLETSKDRFRLVTHYGINKNDIEKTLSIIPKMLA